LVAPGWIWPSRCNGFWCAEPFPDSILKLRSKSLSGWNRRWLAGTRTPPRLCGMASDERGGSEPDYGV